MESRFDLTSMYTCVKISIIKKTLIREQEILCDLESNIPTEKIQQDKLKVCFKESCQVILVIKQKKKWICL